MSHNGDPKASTTVVVGLVGIILLLAVVLFAVALFQHVELIEADRKIYARPYHEVSALRNAQLARLNGYRWVNKEEGVVAIPIERAIELVVGDLKPGRPATTIDNPIASPQSTQPVEQSP